MKKTIITVQSLAIAILAISVEQTHAGDLKEKKSPDHQRAYSINPFLKAKKSPDHIRKLNPTFVERQSPDHVRKINPLFKEKQSPNHVRY